MLIPRSSYRHHSFISGSFIENDQIDWFLWHSTLPLFDCDMLHCIFKCMLLHTSAFLTYSTANLLIFDWKISSRPSFLALGRPLHAWQCSIGHFSIQVYFQCTDSDLRIIVMLKDDVVAIQTLSRCNNLMVPFGISKCISWLFAHHCSSLLTSSVHLWKSVKYTGELLLRTQQSVLLLNPLCVLHAISFIPSISRCSSFSTCTHYHKYILTFLPSYSQCDFVESLRWLTEMVLIKTSS